jgi:anti-sigma B factor antagonist
MVRVAFTGPGSRARRYDGYPAAAPASEGDSSMELDIRTEHDGDACLVTVVGEVDVYTSPMLKGRLVEVIEGGCKRLVIVLDGVGFIDSSGLGVLVGALRRLKERGDDLHLVCTREQVLKIFRITGLDKVFSIVSSVEEAGAV